MTTRSIQLTVNLTATGSWSRLTQLQSGSDYSVPSGARAVAKGIRLLNMGSSAVAVSVAIANSTSPIDRQVALYRVELNVGDNSITEGVLVIPSGFSLLARIDSYTDYPPLSVTFQAAVLEITE